MAGVLLVQVLPAFNGAVPVTFYPSFVMYGNNTMRMNCVAIVEFGGEWKIRWNFSL